MAAAAAMATATNATDSRNNGNGQKCGTAQFVRIGASHLFRFPFLRDTGRNVIHLLFLIASFSFRTNCGRVTGISILLLLNNQKFIKSRSRVSCQQNWTLDCDSLRTYRQRLLQRQGVLLLSRHAVSRSRFCLCCLLGKLLATSFVNSASTTYYSFCGRVRLL